MTVSGAVAAGVQWPPPLPQARVKMDFRKPTIGGFAAAIAAAIAAATAGRRVRAWSRGNELL